MVFDQSHSHYESDNSTKPKLASVQDRFLAFVFDALIFAPIFSFFLSQVLKNIERLYYTAPTSFEFVAMLGVCALMACILAILFQTVCLLLFGATPGKLFMKIRVVSVDGATKLTFSQSLTRSTIWVLEALFLGLPMLEVLSHGLRRSLHDRAADTFVKTLKVQGDRGPHFFEAQFIRQMLLAAFLLAITCGIFMTGNLYRMILSGEFAKNELAENKYLCSSVNERISSGENRVDLAVSLFLTDSIAAECLAAEADFALWTLADEQKTWAYYAKMILHSEDEEKKSAYQGKLCSMNAEMCDLASESLDKIAQDSELKKTHTFTVLKTQRDLYQNNIAAVKKDLETLESMQGFRDYAQTVKIKLFWLEEKPEKALGAFDTVALYMSPHQAQRLSSWLCHQEMDEGCESKNYSSCQVLRQQIGTTSAVQDIGSAFALIRESQCKKTPVNYVQVEEIFANDQKAFKLLRAIDSKSEMPESMRKAILLEMATQKNNKEDVVSDLAKQYAFIHDLDRKDIKQLKDYLSSESSMQNQVWQKLYARTIKAAMKINDKENLKALLDFANINQILNSKAEYREAMALAFYQVEDYKKSWQLLKATDMTTKSGRNPASEDLVSLIRKELARRFEAQ